MKTILIPCDLSPAAQKAFQYVACIFANQAISVSVLYVNETDSFENPNPEDPDIESNVAQMTDKFFGNSKFKTELIITKGELTAKVMELVRDKSIDLIVSGTKWNLRATVSNSIKMFQSLSTPMIIVPESSTELRIKNIAYLNDFQEVDDSTVFKMLWDVARTFDARVHILHVNRDNNMVDKEESIIEYYLNFIDHEYIFISNPNIELAVEEYIVDKEIDLLAVLPRNRSHQEERHEQSLVRRFAQHPPVPVLTLT